MNNAIKIKDNIYWIGVNDRRTHIFENYWPLPKGVAYNSYVIADEKVVVIDTVERSRICLLYTSASCAPRPEG